MWYKTTPEYNYWTFNKSQALVYNTSTQAEYVKSQNTLTKDYGIQVVREQELETFKVMIEL